MKVAIYGVGAIGGVMGARLADAGAELSAVARGKTLSAIQARGLGLTYQGSTSFRKIIASDNPAKLGPQDLVIISVKQPALEAVLANIQPLLSKDTRVIIAMNGVPWWFCEGLPSPPSDPVLRSIDPHNLCRTYLPTEQIIGCVVHVAASVPEPGIASQNMGTRLVIGEPYSGVSSLTQSAFELLNQSGFDTELTTQIHQEIWYKLWGNMTMNPLSALTGATSDQMLDDPFINAFACRAMQEASALGKQLGCPIDQTPEERNRVTRQLGAMRTSMLQDSDAGRPLEYEAIVGAVCELGNKLNMPLPNIESLYGMIRLFAKVRGL